MASLAMNTGNWNVIEKPDGWRLTMLCEDGEVRTFFIGGPQLCWETAIDASCEFMDRFSFSSLPADVLMDRCVRNSLRAA